MLIAFLAGTLCGAGASLWRVARNEGDGLKPVLHRAAATDEWRTGFSPSTPALQSESASVVPSHPLRNLFAYFEPPTLRTAAVPAMVAAAQPQPRIIEAPQPEVPHAPPFPYRYIGTFGTRENAFAVFAREGEVVNARIGDTLGDRFTLRRIGVESVDLDWGGSDALRVSAAAPSPR